MSVLSDDPSWLNPEAAPQAAPQFIHCQKRLRLAFEKATGTLNVAPVANPHFSCFIKSIGAVVRDRTGAKSWLKVNGLTGSPSGPMRTGETSADSISGLPKPYIHDLADWTEDGIHWRALKTTLVSSPVVSRTPWLSGPIAAPEPVWFERLKMAVDDLAKFKTDRPCLHNQYMPAPIKKWFGPHAPCEADEWRTAHGDLHWGNITYPELCMLDWEHWGVAPRGFDAATLLVHSIADRNMYGKLEALFEADLNSRSGMIARLYRCAERLNILEQSPSNSDATSALWAEARKLLQQIV